MNNFTRYTLVIFIGVALLGVLLSLGWWQYQRGLIKQQMINKLDQNAASNSIQGDDLVAALANNLDLSYISVPVIEQYYKYFFLDNRTRAGQAGLEMVVPVLIDSGWLLVNMGWLPWTRGSDLPIKEMNLKQSTQPITGVVRSWPEPGFTLGNQLYGNDLPDRLLWLDYEKLNRYFDGKLLPFIVYIDDNHRQALLTDWHFSGVVSVEQHFSYAIQWVAMALVVLLLMLYLLYKLRTKSSVKHISER